MTRAVDRIEPFLNFRRRLLLTRTCSIKATFHYSSQLQTWNLEMSRLMQQVRVQVGSFVRVLDKWNVEKNRLKPANEPVEAGVSLRILLFVLIMT